MNIFLKNYGKDKYVIYCENEYDCVIITTIIRNNYITFIDYDFKSIIVTKDSLIDIIETLKNSSFTFNLIL